MILDEFEGTIVDSLTKVDINGWWQTYVMSEKEDEGYVPLGNRMLFYNGKFYDKSSKQPWDQVDVDSITNMMYLYNGDGLPHVVVKLERRLDERKDS